MKNITRNILVGAVSVLALASCELDQFPKNSIVYDENQPVIQKPSDLASFERGIMARFRAVTSGDCLIVDEVMGDAFNATLDYGNQYGPVHRTNADYTASDQDIKTIWGDWYVTIKDYNIAIAAANNIADADLKRQAQTMKGEAFCFRAYTYLQLVRHFAKPYNSASATSDLGVPVVTVYDQNARPARNTVAEVYAQIKDDLDSAAFYLADVKGAVRANRPTIDFVKAVYARYYLDVKDYDNAAAMADDVIATGTYVLSTTAKEMEDEFVNDKGKEAIMQMSASLTEKPAQMDAWTRIATANGENVFQSWFLPAKKLVEAYGDDDIRRAAWFSFGEMPVFMRGSLWRDITVFTKFIGNLSYTSASIPDGRNAVKPIRISEMYLISAEAKAAAGNETGALGTLNVLRDARGGNDLSGSMTITDAVRNEWFKETVGEGQRTVCLKRWGIGYEGRAANPGSEGLVMTSGDSYTTKTMAAGDYRMTWPIPTYEMQTNTNLKQNPGYGGVSE